MAKHLIRRLLPDPRSIREHRSLRWLGTLLHDPSLWGRQHYKTAAYLQMA
ncbi:hypothetical protein [Acidihalobacter ferrooxydans]|nr:hypothetical protein [Acidihalobacter ferrooxydans]